MNDLTLYAFSETIPNWIMALSALSAVSVFFWRRQDRQEAQAAREEGIKESVNAVWVTAKIGAESQEKWGILVTNALQSPVTELTVSCSGNATSNELSHPQLHPGKHFFESMPYGSPRSWGLPTNDITSFEYITASKKHTTRVTSFQHSGTLFTMEPATHS